MLTLEGVRRGKKWTNPGQFTAVRAMVAAIRMGIRFALPIWTALSLLGFGLVSTYRSELPPTTTCWIAIEGQLVDPRQAPHATVRLEIHGCSLAARDAIVEAEARGETVTTVRCAGRFALPAGAEATAAWLVSQSPSIRRSRPAAVN